MSRATKEELVKVLSDVKALGYDLKDQDDKTSLYNFIIDNDSNYELADGTVIQNISIKQLFWIFNNQKNAGTRLQPKS